MKEFGRYIIKRKIGKGGMGAVYEACLVGPGGFRKTVALKVLTSELSEIDDLAREATLGGLMRHPNLVDTYEYGNVEGVDYIAMEYIDGPTLSHLIRSGPMSPDAVIQVATQIATGLAHAHRVRVGDGALGLVHRDLKPANILISRFGVVKIADFGIAQESEARTERVAGTPGYMSPEQWCAEAVDARSDLWALGSIIYRAIVGRPLARKGGEFLRLRKRIADGDVGRELDDVMPGLGPVVQRCIDFDPAARYERAGDLKRALAAIPLKGSADLGTVLRTALSDFAVSQLVVSPVSTGGAHSASPLAHTDLEPSSQTDLPRRTFKNVREDASDMLGRTRELEEMRAHFDAKTRIVSLRGPGGVGKSRLARAGARQLQVGFPGGMIQVDLELFMGRARFLQAVALPLGLSVRATEPEVEEMLASGGELLLILDGTEGLGADVASLLDGWLSRLPGLRILASGRSALGLQDEVIVEVGPLDVEVGVALFSARAKRAASDDVRQLVEALCGNALAIELCAERARIVPPKRMLQQLEKAPFRLLRSSGRRAHAHHRSMEDCIRHSWSRLSDEAWQVARVLAARDAPAAFDELEEACEKAGVDASSTMDGIDALIESSFATVDEEGQLSLYGLHQSFVVAFGAQNRELADQLTQR